MVFDLHTLSLWQHWSYTRFDKMQVQAANPDNLSAGHMDVRV